MNHITSTTSSRAEAVLMRRATSADASRVRKLALLDDRRVPAGPLLVAELGGEIVAARSLSTGAVIADPFRLTADVVALLNLRAAQASELGERRESRSAGAATRERSLETAAVAA
jgi:hypothetical protein